MDYGPGSQIFHCEVDPKRQISWDPKAGKAFFDDVNRELVFVKPYGFVSRIGLDGTEIEKKYAIETTDVKNVKYSPDFVYLTIQRNDKELEFVNTVDGSKFSQACKNTPKIENKILGFYWTNLVNFIIITRNGLELYCINKGNSVSRVKDFDMAVGWFVYSSTVRILLLATGNRENVLYGFHFTIRPNTFIKLPKFEIPLADKELLREKDICISQIYSRVYCIHSYTKQRELHLYHLTKDVIEKKLTVDLHASGQCYVSVLDNLIITHNVSQKVSMVFDINARHPKETHISFPVAAPLPLAPVKLDTKSANDTIEIYDDWQFILPRHVLDARKGYLFTLSIRLDSVCLSFSDRIKLIDFLLRRTGSKDLLIGALKQMLEERESLFSITQIFDAINDVLLQYTSEQLKKGDSSPSDLKSDWFATPPSSPSISRAGTLSPSGSSSSLLGSSNGFTVDIGDLARRRTEHFWAEFQDQKQRDKGVTVADADERKLREAADHERGIQQQMMKQLKTSDGKTVIEQEDMYTQVFVPIDEKGTLDDKVMVAVIGEYIRSLNFHRLKVNSFIYELMVDLLVHNNRFYQLHQLLQYHVISDSIHVACQLLSLGSSYPPATQLALDMFKRLHEPLQIVEVLLTQGMLLPAMRYLRATGIDAKALVPRFFQEARRTGDTTIYYTTFKFFNMRKEIDPKLCGEYIEYYKSIFSAVEDDTRSLPSQAGDLFASAGFSVK